MNPSCSERFAASRPLIEFSRPPVTNAYFFDTVRCFTLPDFETKAVNVNWSCSSLMLTDDSLYFNFFRRGPTRTGKRREYDFANLVQRRIESLRNLRFENGIQTFIEEAMYLFPGFQLDNVSLPRPAWSTYLAKRISWGLQRSWKQWSAQKRSSRYVFVAQGASDAAIWKSRRTGCRSFEFLHSGNRIAAVLP